MVNIVVNNEKPVPDVQWVICPVCHQRVSQKNLEKHKRKVHQVLGSATIAGASRPSLNVKRVKCPECKCDVAESNLLAHIARDHGKAGLARVNALKQVHEARLNRNIVCPTCKVQIRLGDVKGHFGNAHNSPAPAHLLALMGEKPASNKFSTVKEKNEYWRKLDGLDSKRSEDALDQGPRKVFGGHFVK